MIVERVATNRMNVTVAAKRTSHGRFVNRSFKSRPTEVFWACNGSTRSLVPKKVIRKKITAAPPIMMNAISHPRAGLLAPKNFVICGRLNLTTNPAENAKRNLNEDKLVRSRGLGEITPSREVYGILIAV